LAGRHRRAVRLSSVPGRMATPGRTATTNTKNAGSDAGVFVADWVKAFLRSRARRAADIDHVAVADGGVLVDEAGDQHPSVEGDDLAVLLAGGRTGRPDIVLAARRALEAQFLRGRLVGQMHDHAAGLAGSDHVRLLALVARH